MATLKFDIKGTSEVIRHLKQFGAEGRSEVSKITEFKAKDIELNAKLAAPVNKAPNITGGDLRQSIVAEKYWFSQWTITAGMEYAPFVEFGTGSRVSVPSELTGYAMQFKGAGIRQVNVPAQPFLYPAWKKGTISYEKDLRKAFERLTKKYNG